MASHHWRMEPARKKEGAAKSFGFAVSTPHNGRTAIAGKGGVAEARVVLTSDIKHSHILLSL